MNASRYPAARGAGRTPAPRPTALTLGGIAVDFVKTRGVIRVHGVDTVAEVEPAELLERLGIDVAELASIRRYLLFASTGPASGGADDLVGVFGSEADARRAFVDLRGEDRLRRGWAELIAVGVRGQVSVLCSFGRGRPVRWRRRFDMGPTGVPSEVTNQPSRSKKGTTMSTNLLTETERSARALPKRSRQIRLRVGTGIASLAAAGSVLLLLAVSDSTTTPPSPAPAAPQSTLVAPVAPASPSDEVFGGCLNDTECYGEPSSLPPGYWDPPLVGSVD